MNCWILWLLLFCGCNGGNGGNCGCGGGGSTGYAAGRSGNDGGNCGCNGNDSGYGQSRVSGAMPAAWSSDCGCDQDSRSFSGRQDFPSVGRGDTCGCEKQD